MNMKQVMAMALGIAALPAMATLYNVKNVEVTDFADPSNYYLNWNSSNVATVTPNTEDTVYFPNGGTWEFDASSESFKTLARTKLLAFRCSYDKTTRELSNFPTVIINVKEGETAVVKATIKLFVTDTTEDDMSHHDQRHPERMFNALLIKRGKGTLYLDNYNSESMYYPTLNLSCLCAMKTEVEEGTLQLPSGYTGDRMFGPLNLAKGAKLIMPTGGSSCAYFYGYLNAPEGSFIEGLDGTSHPYGICPSEGCEQKSIIKATISGATHVRTRGDIEQVSNTYGSSAAHVFDGATLTIPAMGANQWTQADGWNASPIGKQYMIELGVSKLGLGGRLLYTGEGEHTHALARCYTWLSKEDGSSADPVVIDAGKTGGIVFRTDTADRYFGPYTRHSDQRIWDSSIGAGVWVPEMYGCFRIVLAGDNAKECVIRQPMQIVTDGDGIEYPAYINKEGKGTWRFSTPDKGAFNHIGVTQISDGTLKFDTIAEWGEPCSLGLSTNLRPDDSRALNEEYFDPSMSTVPYAFLLGSDDSHGEPVFEYSGGGTAVCSTRPLALAGNGGTLKASAGALDFGGVSAKDENQVTTLKLDGEGEQNILREVTDGPYGAQVSIEKNGPGTWTLMGNQDISGTIGVNAGKLKLNVTSDAKEKPFRWYRLSIAQIGADGTARNDHKWNDEDMPEGEHYYDGGLLRLADINLYDEAGNSLTKGMTVVNDVEVNKTILDAPNLEPGQCGWDATMVGRDARAFKDPLANLFDNNYATTAQMIFSAVGERTDGQNWQHGDPDPNNPASWYRIVMRLPDDAPTVTHFDILGSNATNTYMPTRVRLEGSIDGKDWKVVSDLTAGDAWDWGEKGSAGRWMSDPAATGDAHATLALEDANPYFWATEFGAYEFMPFKWFKVTIAKHGDSGSGKWVGGGRIDIGEFCLYSEDGIRQNSNLTFVDRPGEDGSIETTTYNAPLGDVKPGCVAYACEIPYHRQGKTEGNQGIGYGLDNMFKNNFNVYKSDFLFIGDPCKEENERTWVKFVMHLRDDAQPITHFDIFGDMNSKAIPRQLKIEGSVDGLSWTELYSNIGGDDFADTDASLGSTGGWWLSTLERATNEPNYEQHQYANSLFQFFQTGISANEIDGFADNIYIGENMQGFLVHGEGTLSATGPFELDHLIVDARKGDCGTLENFTLVEGGLITVRNIPPMGAKIRLPNLVDCEGSMADWYVLVENEGFGASIKGDYIVVTSERPGMVILVK